MRIGFSLVDLAAGGAQTMLVQLAEGLAARGHQIECYLRSEASSTVYTNPFLLNQLTNCSNLTSTPRSLISCDVIQLDGYHSLKNKLPYFGVRDKCIETYHSLYSIDRSRPLLIRNRVAVSQFIKTYLPPSTVVIPNGISLPDIPLNGVRPFDVAILGRIHPVKGHDFFLRVCDALYQELGFLNVLCIGGFSKTGPFTQKIMAEIDRLRSKGINIHVTGVLPYSEVYAWLSKVKILLAPSVEEGFGRMAIEAMACYVPVVANPVGGLKEIILDRQTGFLARLDNLVSFRDITLELLKNTTLRLEISRNGRHDVESKYTIQQMVEAYEMFYQMVEGKNR